MRTTVLLTDARTRRELQAAVGAAVPAVYCRDAADLTETLRTIEAGAVLVALCDEHGSSRVRLIARLRAEFRFVPLVGVVRLGTADRDEIIPAIHAGISHLLLLGVDDPTQVIRRALEATDRQALHDAVLAHLSPHVPHDAWSFVECAVRSADRRTSVAGFARQVGVPSRILNDRLRSARLPAARLLLTWTRLLVAGHLISHHNHTVTQAARVVRYPRALDLRRRMRRLAEVRPSALTDPGNFAILITRFVASLDSEGSDETGSTKRRARLEHGQLLGTWPTPPAPGRSTGSHHHAPGTGPLDGIRANA